MLKVALTGNLGSGKSTIAKFFEECGFFVYDADKIIKSFYTEKGEVYQEILRVFGKSVLSKDGSIDIKKLADMVFSNKEKLLLLENITHPALYRKLEEEFKKLPRDAVAIIEASLVLEKKSQGKYDFVVVVYAPYEVCKLRAINKGMKKDDFERRWSKQMDPLEKLKMANYIIDNSGDIQETKDRVKELCRVFKNIVSF